MSHTYSGENTDKIDTSGQVDDQVTEAEAATAQKLESAAKRSDADVDRRTAYGASNRGSR